MRQQGENRMAVVDENRVAAAVVDIGNTLRQLAFNVTQSRSRLMLDVDNACWTGGNARHDERLKRTRAAIDALLVELREWEQLARVEG